MPMTDSCEHSKESSGSIKFLISWVTKQLLASQEGLGSIN